MPVGLVSHPEPSPSATSLPSVGIRNIAPNLQKSAASRVPDGDKIRIVALRFRPHKNGGAGHDFGHFSDTDLVPSDVTNITLGVLIIIPI